ncbi:hypothetical protein FB45DRAFT_903341 [Roridomyces roridus]|uniref:F-box domain-containing protein n=1 Tax=Roridomyces roridus TaxID=1738132 RepID=A0AAD7FR36_9AGAR|nr:hypothetical protein FB45DRAFT_903341 [Roridomyces roridus]
MHVLPTELKAAVLADLDSTSLATVARTCRSVYPVALSILYRHLCVSDATSVVLTLASRPDIARHVRSFHLTLRGTVFSPFLRSWVLPDSRVYPQLQHFASPFPLDTHLAKFLGNAPALTSVYIERMAEMQPLSLLQGCMRQLAKFTGSVHVNSGDLIVPALGKSTELVTVLDVTTDSAPVNLLHDLGQHLPHLIYLRITSTRNFPAPPTPIFYEQVAGSLTAFPHLQSFEFLGMYWPSSKKPENEQRVWQSRPLTNSSPEETVDLYSYSEDNFIS